MKRTAALLAASLGAVSLVTLVTVAALPACSEPPSDGRIGVDAPDFSQYPPVSDFMDHRCGTLDCHGNAQRNMVLWGSAGLRLSPTDVPGGRRTTSDEYEASYRSLVGLEPAVMSAVIEGHGAQPDALTFIRKARGEEAHKGGQLVTPGDPEDVCMTSWLAGATDMASCAQALCMADSSECPAAGM